MATTETDPAQERIAFERILRSAFNGLPARVQSLASREGKRSFVEGEVSPALLGDAVDNAAYDVIAWLRRTPASERFIEDLVFVVYDAFRASALLDTDAPNLSVPDVWFDDIEATFHRSDLALPAEMGGNPESTDPMAAYLQYNEAL